MRRPPRRFLVSWAAIASAAIAVAASVMATGSARAAATDVVMPKPLPWAAAGWTERQAAAHLLDRFAFGARPGDVDRVVKQGLERWLEVQLAATADDTHYGEKVRSLDAWRMPASEIMRTFPPPIVMRREAMQAGLIDRDAAPPDPDDPKSAGAMAEQRAAIQRLARERGYRSQRELIDQLMAHKLLQATYSENQLQAVLVDFWFNHFNVSLTDNQARGWLLSYERDAIAPGVLGKFGDLLAAVAAHPAMLFYLDNAQSTANPDAATTLDRRRTESGMGAGRGAGMRGGMGDGGGSGNGGGFGSGGGRGQLGAMGGAGSKRPRGGSQPAAAQGVPPGRRSRGLNENYARELLELHTLGVDGGYTQDDVIAVARAFSGWTALPPGGFGDQMRERMRRAGGGGRLGYVIADDGFVFRADAHDAEAKTVLGRKLPAGRGIEDGRDVLAMVALHPSTARHLATKIAARFVADEPPPALVDRLARTFLDTGGDLREVMRTLVYSPEFWSRDARGAKIKSPFELAVSAVRAVDGDVSASQVGPRMGPERPTRGARDSGLIDWIGRMGQPLYAYQAPTGFPDRAEAWVSTGSLLSRMNFGLQLAGGRVPGVAIDLAALDGGREPESPEHALSTYAALLLPERDLAGTLERLAPLIRDPALGGRVERAAADSPAATPAAAGTMIANDGSVDDEIERGAAAPPRGVEGETAVKADIAAKDGPRGPLEIQNVVGLILGSPEFQRR